MGSSAHLAPEKMSHPDRPKQHVHITKRTAWIFWSAREATGLTLRPCVAKLQHLHGCSHGQWALLAVQKMTVLEPHQLQQNRD
jgi:hypothetical protein